MHRKGLLHSNVDTLSRPALINSIMQVNESDEKTNLEIWQDDGAISYFKTGCFPNGASNKQVKRLKRLGEKYKIEDGKLFYLLDNKYLEVPKPEERKEIINKAHLLEHKTLINSLGVVHKVTSAYNPRLNGMTERFNQTFIESFFYSILK